MSRKWWKAKQEQKPRPKPRPKPIEVNESLNAFITLRLGKDAFEGLLSTSTPAFLRWIARNTLLAIHAEEIRNRFSELNTDVDVSGKLSDGNGGETERISSSAAARRASIYAGPQDISAGDQVS